MATFDAFWPFGLFWSLIFHCFDLEKTKTEHNRRTSIYLYMQFVDSKNMKENQGKSNEMKEYEGKSRNMKKNQGI